VPIQAGRRALGRKLVGWVAAYALALHAFVAASLLPRIASPGIADEASIFVLCADDSGSMPAPGGLPGGMHDCDAHCTLARGPGTLFVLLSDLEPAGIIEPAAVSMPRPVADAPPSTRIRLIREPPRGPPQTA
jgi:hypothetical protein